MTVYLAAKLSIDTQVLERLSKLVDIDRKLTIAEDALDIKQKQENEDAFAKELEWYKGDHIFKVNPGELVTDNGERSERNS